jgi:hypothetical protein
VTVVEIYDVLAQITLGTSMFDRMGVIFWLPSKALSLSSNFNNEVDLIAICRGGFVKLDSNLYHFLQDNVTILVDGD